jgi:hypothetical protein
LLFLPHLFDQVTAKRPCYGRFKLMLNSNINLIGVITLFVYFWPSPTTIDEVLATINSFQHKLMNFHIIFMNLLELFDGGLRKNMCKAAHPSSSMDSSNLRR